MTTSTSTMITLFLIMMSINVGLVLFQEGVAEYTTANIINISNSPYSAYVVGDSFIGNSNSLPADSDSEADTTGNIFSDNYKTLKGWLQNTMAGFGFLSSILTQPYGFMKDVGVPIPIRLAIAVFWYGLALLIIISWLGGR